MTVTVTTTQFCYFSSKATIENIQLSEHGYFLIKLIKNQPMGYSLLTPDLSLF